MKSEETAHAPERSPLPVARLLRPRSIAIVGISPSAGSAGAGVLANLERFNYGGEVHLVSRNRTEVGGRACVSSIDDLPEGVDAVVLALPRGGVVEAVQACARRCAGAAMIFASGFAEAGAQGAELQSAITQLAGAAGMLVGGPNCVGLTNFIDGIPLTFAPAFPAPPLAGRALAIVAQSGGMMANLRSACVARGVSVAYAISTGNEAVLGIEDYLAEMIGDDRVSVIGLFVEHIRRPQLFLELAARARAVAKPLVMLHPGRSAAAREAALSHTGALSVNFEVMKMRVEREAVVWVETLEELVDSCEILTRFAAPPVAGAAVLTDSGAFKGFAIDFCETEELELPMLAPQTCAALAPVLPEFASASNPLDITAQGILNPQLYGDCARALLSDAASGSLVVSILPGSPAIGLAIGRSILPALAASSRPVAYAVMGGETPLSEDLLTEIRAARLPFFRSPERAIRAMARVTTYGRRLASRRTAPPPAVLAGAELPEPGVLPEYKAKIWLSRFGIPMPQGALAHDAAQAVRLAAKLGYPVVLKAQASALPHKSDAGGVITGIASEAELRAAWDDLHRQVGGARPNLRLDGALIETMAAPGIEMVVGARRVAGWGPVLMIGLGGIWVEILKDVRLLPAELDVLEIESEILKLKAASLLGGARGGTASDVRAVAQTAATLGALMCALPGLEEIELNPLRVYAQGVLALDALVASSPGA